MNRDTKDLMLLLGTAVAFSAVLWSSRLVPPPWDELARLFGTPLIGTVVLVFGLSRSRRLVAPKLVEVGKAK